MKNVRKFKTKYRNAIIIGAKNRGVVSQKIVPLRWMFGIKCLKCEAERAIASAPSNKAAGPDKITSDMTKILGKEGIQLTTKFANCRNNSGKIALTKQICILLPKKPNPKT